MRIAKFTVPTEVIGDFVKEVQERQLEAVIIGATDDDELELRVGYERDDSEKVDELEDRLDELTEGMYEYEEDENEDEDEDEDDKRHRRRR